MHGRQDFAVDYSDAGGKNSDLFLFSGFLDMLDLDLIAAGHHLQFASNFRRNMRFS
jgi:hypothetical protein